MTDGTVLDQSGPFVVLLETFMTVLDKFVRMTIFSVISDGVPGKA